ncbi:MAG: helix-turn-helix transcriptional regulator [Pyrinomonadaceae bacterium]|nr:helix-turn-helix transcriptional regulator [Acidobacteriota bacterium]MBP7415642.1 helix-turn-helix transcriptional regulator [Pyrinomonadaceae bacterium]
MTGRELKEYRKNSRLTQDEAAKVLGVSQTYLSLLESDKRRLTERLKKKLVKKMHVRPTELPAKTKDHKVTKVSDDQLTGDLAALGYKGFSHWKPSQLKNPADVLLSALNADKRDARLVEALPWLLFEFPDLEWNSVVMTAKAHDLQNRLGFVTSVARRMAERHGKKATAQKLESYEAGLERSKLEMVGTLCNETMTNAERKWLATHSTKEAKHWHLLSDLSPRYLDHYVD